MLFTLREFFDIIVMTICVGYIFSDLFKKNQLVNSPFLFSCLVCAPALILHELGHKFVALAFGLSATFHAFYQFLFLGLILKLISFPFIFFVPAYVSFSGNPPPLVQALISAAGPFVNLLLFLTSFLLLKLPKLKSRTFLFLSVTKQINLFLFIFNMLPIPGFDGWTFYFALARILF